MKKVFELDFLTHFSTVAHIVRNDRPCCVFGNLDVIQRFLAVKMNLSYNCTSSFTWKVKKK